MDSRTGHERSHIVYEPADLRIEIAVSNRKAIAFDSNDLSREFEGTNRLDEDIQRDFDADFRDLANRTQAGAGTRDVQERSGSLTLAGRAESVEASPETRMFAAIQSISPIFPVGRTLS